MNSKVGFQRFLYLAVTFCFIAVACESNSDAFFEPEIDYLDVQQTLQDFDTIQNVASQITKICPPEDCFYIGVGRSPTPFVAMLQATLGEHAAINLPLSAMEGFRDGGFMRNSETPVQLHPHDMSRLRTHFDQFIPAETSLHGRRMMLIDFASTGDSLINTRTQLQDYLVANHRPSQIIAAAIPDQDASLKTLEEEHIKILHVNQQVLDRVSEERYKALAEYQPFTALRGGVHRLPPPDDPAQIPAHHREYTPPEKIAQASKKDGYEDLVNAFKLRLANQHEPSLGKICDRVGFLRKLFRRI